MKNILYLLTILSTQLLFSQSNEIKARIEFEDAEKYFSESNYNEALTHLNNAQKLIGLWNHKISYMKIMCYDAIVNYNDWNQSIENLNKEVQLYMAYADNNSDKVDTDKFRQVYSIEEKIKNSKKIKDYKRKIDEWVKMEENIDGINAIKNRDYDLAFKHFKKSADKGNGCSMEAIGSLYRYGYGVEKNYFTALDWYKKALENGHLLCYQYIGDLYYRGFKDFNKNYPEAYKWYLKAAEYGENVSMWNIAQMNFVGVGSSQNYNEAFLWYKKSAENGYIHSYVKLGTCFLEGYGINKNLTEAFNWYKKGADAGEPNAMVGLANLYYGGLGVTENYTEGEFWMKKAGDNANKEDQFEIGKFFLETLNNAKLAIKYMEAAISRGYNINDNRVLADAYFKDQQYIKALEAYIIAFNNGNTNTKYAISNIYKNGLGVPKDKKIAKEWESK
jgi:TPR repeat protein